MELWRIGDLFTLVSALRKHVEIEVHLLFAPFPQLARAV
jgi:hypothetical protein